MTKCISCNSPDGRPVFRTNPLGEENAGWMCEPCIAQHHDKSLIDPEVKEVVGALAGAGGPNPEQECAVAVAERDEAQEAAEQEESKLVKHARRELQLAGFYEAGTVYGPGTIAESILELVTVLSKQGHSGGSHSIVMAVFGKVANFQPLAPLTNDPAEWVDHKEFAGAAAMRYQSLRSSSAFSADGGKTYWLGSEQVVGQGFPEPSHTSKEVEPTGPHPTRF